VIRTPTGRIGNAGPQHSQSMEPFFLHIPGWKVAVPSTPYDAKGLLKTAIRDDNPVLFFEHKMLYGMKGPVPEEDDLIPFGKAKIVRKGENVTVVATFLMLYKTLNVAKKLAEEGISVEVIDPQTLVPLDAQTIINSVKKTGRLVIAEESHKMGGMGAEIAGIIIEKAFEYLDAPIQRVAALDLPIPFSPPLENYVLPDEAKIEKAIREIV